MKLSVIVPVYNMADGDKLTWCLNSLVNQTISDYEIIAVDDCSTDCSLEILRDYEVAVYPRRDDSWDTSVPIPIEEEIEKGNIEVEGVTHIEVPLLDVSSTMVRQRIRCGEDITSLIPETVVAEVEKDSLYR